MEKIKCSCKNLATWLYMPSSSFNKFPFYCDNCVNRGCSCNLYSIKGKYRNEPKGKEGVDWEWVVKEGYEPNTYWRNIDEEGRAYPCCEYDYKEEGFDKEEL